MTSEFKSLVHLVSFFDRGSPVFYDHPDTTPPRGLPIADPDKESTHHLHWIDSWDLARLLLMCVDHAIAAQSLDADRVDVWEPQLRGAIETAHHKLSAFLYFSDSMGDMDRPEPTPPVRDGGCRD